MTPRDVVHTRGGRLWVQSAAPAENSSFLASTSAGGRTDLFAASDLAHGRPSASFLTGYSRYRLIGASGAVGIESLGFMRLFDVDASSSIRQVGLARPHGFGGGIVDTVEHRGLLWILRGCCPSIDVLDVRVPTLPQYFEPISTKDTVGIGQHFAIGHGRMYVSNSEEGIDVIDISDLTAPRSLGVWPEKSGELFIVGSHLLVVDGNQIEVIDPTDAVTPRTVAFARFPHDPNLRTTVDSVFACKRPLRTLALVDSVLYRLTCTRRPGATSDDGRGRLDVVDFLSPERPATLPAIELGHGGRIISGGEAAWAATEDAGLIEITVVRR